MRCRDIKMRGCEHWPNAKRNSDGTPMNCPRKLLIAVLSVGLAGAAFAALRAQQPPAQGPGQPPSLKSDDSRGRIRTTVSLVVVPVTVKDSAGGLVTDLTQNDFRIFEDGIEQPIALFSVDAFP